MSQFRVSNRYLVHEMVRNATISLAAGPGARAMPPITGTTNVQGALTLAINGLADGSYSLTVTPEHTSSDPVGPAIVNSGQVPDRVYRTLTATVQIRGGVIAGVLPLGTGNGKATGSGDVVKVELQPVFMKSPNSRHRGATVDLIILHHTAGPSLTSSLNAFISGQLSSHYLVDKDGEIVKVVPDQDASFHAGKSFWQGREDLNNTSIGIEIVNMDGEAFPDAQYAAVVGLLGRLRAAIQSIPAVRVIGHSDIGVNADGRLGRKSSCPGSRFDWRRVEQAGFGLNPGTGANVDGVYGGLFRGNAAASFRLHDRDDRHVFGGHARKDVPGMPIHEIQSDLATIGYSVGTPSGIYDEKTHFAVQMFQEHFFAGGRGGTPTGHVDLTTAGLIKGVLGNRPT